MSWLGGILFGLLLSLVFVPIHLKWLEETKLETNEKEGLSNAQVLSSLSKSSPFVLHDEDSNYSNLTAHSLHTLHSPPSNRSNRSYKGKSEVEGEREGEIEGEIESEEDVLSISSTHNNSSGMRVIEGEEIELQQFHSLQESTFEGGTLTIIEEINQSDHNKTRTLNRNNNNEDQFKRGGILEENRVNYKHPKWSKIHFVLIFTGATLFVSFYTLNLVLFYKGISY